MRPDARLCADRRDLARIARDLRGGMNAFRRGRLQIRDNLHLGVGFLAATSGSTDPARLEMARVRTPLGDIAVARAGDPDAPPVVMLHGLGGTKGSFLPTVAALADSYRDAGDRPAGLRRLGQARSAPPTTHASSRRRSAASWTRAGSRART